MFTAIVYLSLVAVLPLLCIITDSSPPGRRIMKAVQQSSTGELYVSKTVPIPTPVDREVLINIKYTAVNRMDLVQAKGLYPLPPGVSPILGVEVSGVVEAVGSGCLRGFKRGDEVMALLDGGGYAEFAVSDERTVMKLLPGMDLLKSSAIPEAFMTAFQLLFLVAEMKAGESVLIHAGASSIGQAAIQLAREKGLVVYTSTRSEEKLQKLQDLGANKALLVNDQNGFSDAILTATQGLGVDVILDPVGSSYLRENLEAIAYDGRFVLYGLLSGGVIDETINNNTPQGFLRKLLFKRVKFLSTTLRARSVEYKEDIIQQLKNDPEAGFRAITAEKIKIDISSVFSLEQVNDAHALMALNKNVGKIVMSIEPLEEIEVHEL